MQHLDEGTLQAWLDRPRSGMGAERALEVERHLGVCDACTSALSDLAALDAEAAEILRHSEPSEVEVPDFSTVLDPVHPTPVLETSGTGSTARGLRSLAWAASLVLALGAGWMARDIYRTGGANTGAPDVALAPDSEVAPLRESTGGGAPDDEVLLPTETPPEAAAVAQAPPPAQEEDTRSLPEPRAEAFAAPTDAAPPPPPSQASPVGAADAVALGAAARASADPVGTFLILPGLEVVEVEAVPTGEAVRVVQTLADSTRLVMVQSRGAPLEELGEVPEGQPVQTIERDGLFIVGTAPIPADSLGILLEGLGR